MPQIPGVRVQHFLYLPGTSVSSVRPCHNTRNFCEFCNTSIPVPKASGSSVRLPYPYPESANPTEHNIHEKNGQKIPRNLPWKLPCTSTVEVSIYFQGSRTCFHGSRISLPWKLPSTSTKKNNITLHRNISFFCLQNMLSVVPGTYTGIHDPP